LVYALLIVYASWYPFSGWRTQGVWPWDFLTAPWPQYWTWFDVLTNVAGYVPWGMLLALAWVRTSERVPGWKVVLGTGAAGAALSFCMEAVQINLPMRIASNVDWLLNSFGATVGAGVALLSERMGWIATWTRLRAAWFASDAGAGVALCLLWPVALLSPTAVPFGLGQVWERLTLFGMRAMPTLAEWLGWNVDDLPTARLSSSGTVFAVTFAMLSVVWLAYGLMPSRARRVAALMGAVAVGWVASSLSSALSFGPAHAWVWWSVPVQAAVALTVLIGFMTVLLPSHVCSVLAVMALAFELGVINQVSTSAYFWQTLQTWEQGAFIRFYGVAQWLGWLWPYAALVYLLRRIARRDVWTR
jgi:VanZ family protein